MAIDAFIWFQGYDGKYLESESQVDFSRDPQQSLVHYPPSGEIFTLSARGGVLEIHLQAGGRQDYFVGLRKR
jgi:hypothetical protein